MHLGNVRTALFNVLFAKSQDGEFLLRIEDTDRERSDDRYTSALLADLKWLAIDWQEGPEHDLGCGPYFQSERQAIYDDYYQRLETAKLAYPCFCSEEELALQRKIQRSSGRPPRYPGTCRRLSEEAVQEKQAQGLKSTLRFAVPENEKIIFEDLVRGQQVFESNDLGDFIIRRTDGTPPFLYCNAIDDAMMGVTHALRGEDHLTNTPRQLLLLEALGLTPPTYGHIALIVGPDGSPLSKRHGSRSIDALRADGYLASALTNYMARLGHYYGHDDLLTMHRLAEQFQIKSLVKSPAKFNLDQLHYWQKQAVSALDERGFWLWVGDTEQNKVPSEQHHLFMETIQPNVMFPADVEEWIAIIFSNTFSLTDEQKAELSNTPAAYFDEAAKYLEQHGLDYDGLINHLKNTLQVKGKALFMPLRIAITGKTHGPELPKLFLLIGKTELIRRIQHASL